ncbi:hypothetical protein BBD42_14315 [Paenibacillus sp. BIHB 4019]|uniref:Uncharacterized protein n=1 Tax=Paenibacillus sp. BIHB 4019 TaxID=1870819 RepID=A0A1B2DIJ1_9BACL|nr:RHS repeat-associated core domain-containing protein [Paenibacillus sp. BIHB 4019]ANY67516.1 hypothetical protein BBD42_14315 [Paenibacillus sp. BIHB 4019]
MSTEKKAIGYEQLRLQWPYAVQQIQGLRIEKRVNEHALLWVSGILPEEREDQDLQLVSEQDQVELHQVDEQGGMVRILFSGTVASFMVRAIRSVYTFELTVLSHTSSMDLERNTRSFQHGEMLYDELLKTVLAAYPRADTINEAAHKEKLGELTLQYEETDWTFLKRMASRFGAVLVPEAAAASPKFWFGLGEGRLVELPLHSYTIAKTLSPYREAAALGEGESLREQDFLGYEVVSEQVLQIGDRVEVKGRELAVAEVGAELRQALLVFTYKLLPPSGIRQSELFNEQVVGAALEGRILEVKNAAVRVQLDVDTEQKQEEASWLPYASVYASEDGTGMHCMPEQGDAVQVYFPSRQEGEAMALSSVRKSGQDSPKMADSSVKSWTTPYGKEMKLAGQELSLIAQEGVLFIQLHEENGIEIRSDTAIAIKSEQPIELSSETKLAITAQEGLYLVCGNSSIVMDGDTDVLADELLLVGTYFAPVVVEDLDEEEVLPVPLPEPPPPEPEEPKKKGGWLGTLLDVVQVGLDIAGCVPGLGVVANVANAAISVGRGDYLGAAMSMASCIVPGAGPALKGARMAKNAAKAGKAMMKAANAAKATGKTLSAAQKAFKSTSAFTKQMVSGIKAVDGKVLTAARKVGSNLDKLEQVQKLKKVMKLPGVEQALDFAGDMAMDYVLEKTGLENLAYLSYLGGGKKRKGKRGKGKGKSSGKAKSHSKGKGKGSNSSPGKPSKKLNQEKQKKAKKESAKKDPSKADKRSCKNDPIHAGSGGQFIIHPALKLYGADTWMFEMHYHSLLETGGAMGAVWTHNFELALTFEEDEADSAAMAADHTAVNRVEADHAAITEAEAPFGKVLLAKQPIAEANPPGVTVWRTKSRRNRFVRQADGVYRSADSDVLGEELRQEPEGYVLWLRETQEQIYFNPAGQALKWVNAHGQALEMRYDAQGRLASLTDAITRQALKLAYDTQGLLSRVSEGKRTIRMQYNASHQMTRYIDANGNETDIGYHWNGKLARMSVGGAVQYENTFDEFGRITSQSDASGAIAYLDYDVESRFGYTITTATDRLGAVEVLVHDDLLQLVEIVQKDSSLVQLAYNEQGKLISETQADGSAVAMAYDDYGQLVSMTDALGHETSYVYDEQGLLVSETDEEGRTTAYAYDGGGRLAEILRADGAVAKMTYNANGQRESYVDFNGVTTSYAYGPDGRVLQIKDGEERMMVVEYDLSGRVASLGYPTGGTILREYDANDNLVKVIDPLKRVYAFGYDAFDRKTLVTLPSGAATAYVYNANGLLEREKDALGQVTAYRYDAEERLVARTDARGGQTQYEWDEADNLVAVTDALGRTERFGYDGLGRVNAMWDASGVQIAQLDYDAAGNRVAEINALGQATRYRFNKAGQIAAKENAKGQQTTFAYDAVARITEVMEHDEATYRQSYDGEGQITSYTDANGNETKLTYDRSGLLEQEENGTGEVLRFSYDNHGWLKRRENARGQQAAYGYDAAGQLKSIKDEAGQIDLSYNIDGNVIRVEEEGRVKRRTFDILGRLTSCQDSNGQTIRYAYDEAGNLRVMTYPEGKQVTYSYDLAGQMTQVKDWRGRVTRYSYDVNGRLVRTERPNGSIEQRGYDVQGQLVRLWDINRQGVMLQQYRMTYNELGQLVEEEEKQYTYDNLRRLVSGAMPGRKLWYSYDLGGNLTEAGEAPLALTAMSYAQDNRLATVNGKEVVYDADGNLLVLPMVLEKDVQAETATYRYDVRNRLTQAGRTSYTYDAEQVRMSLTWRGQTTHYVTDQVEELSRVLLEQDGRGETKAYFVYGAEGLIGREDSMGRYQSYHYDLRGSTTLLTDEKGRVTDRYTYGLYGERESHEGTTRQPFCYNGRDGVMTDPNGLYYMRARYYHTGIKRFLNRDVLRGSIVEGQTFNRFGYVNGDPVSFIDPFGLEALSGCKAWKDKIVLPSKPHSNKTEGHWFASKRKAVEEAKKEDTVKVYLNKGLQREVPGAKPRRPDVMVVKTNGKIDQYEVPSKTDDVLSLRKRMIENQKYLGDRAGKTEILNIRKR